MIEIMRRTQFDPARLHGHIKMELIDAKTKQVLQTTEKDNMVTNALKYLLNDVAGGTPDNLGNLLMPVATRALGGIMLFSDVLEEREENIHFPFAQNQNGDYSYLVAAAGRDTNTSNSMHGSLNAAESGATDRGYVSVWDFGTSQANGTIKAAALTQYTSDRGTSPFRTGLDAYSAHTIRRSDGATSWSAQPLYYDKSTGMLYFTSADSSMGYSRTSSSGTYTYTMSIYATYLPLQSYKVGDAVDRYTMPVFVKSISWQDTWVYTPNFCPGYDGNAYYATSNGNTSGNGTIHCLTLVTDDLSFRLTGPEVITGIECYLRNAQAIVHGEDIWALSNDLYGIYCIMPGIGDAIYFAFPEGYQGTTGRLCPGGGINLTLYCAAADGRSGYYDMYDAMIYPDGTIVKNGAYFIRSTGIYTGERSYGQCSYESEYLWCWGGVSGYYSTAFGSIGVISARYLGTIANLSTPIVKNATQTLKVTYTLTDE